MELPWSKLHIFAQRRAIVRLGIDTLIVNILVFVLQVRHLVMQQ